MGLTTKGLLAVAATVGVLGIAACGDDEEPAAGADSSTGTATQAAPEKLDIAYIQTGPFPYYVRGVDGAKAAADELGLEIDVLDSQNKPAQEIANVEDAIQRGVDGIVLFSVGKASEKAALAKARAADVPVAVLYGYDEKLEDQGVVFIQAPAPDTGRQAGAWVAENVDAGEVAVIQGLLGRGDAEAYTDGFREGVGQNAELKVVAEPAADWDRAKAQAAMQDLISAHPRLKAVFVQNEDMALGAVAALKAAGKDDAVKVVSQNGSPEGIAAVEQGDIAATVAWSPAQEAQMALKRLTDFLRTDTPAEPKVCNTPTILVTKDNADESSPWVPTDESTKASLEAPCAS